MREPATKSKDGSEKTAVADKPCGTKKSRDPKGSQDLNKKGQLWSIPSHAARKRGAWSRSLEIHDFDPWASFLLTEIRA